MYRCLDAGKFPHPASKNRSGTLSTIFIDLDSRLQMHKLARLIAGTESHFSLPRSRSCFSCAQASEGLNLRVGNVGVFPELHQRRRHLVRQLQSSRYHSLHQFNVIRALQASSSASLPASHGVRSCGQLGENRETRIRGIASVILRRIGERHLDTRIYLDKRLMQDRMLRSSPDLKLNFSDTVHKTRFILKFSHRRRCQKP